MKERDVAEQIAIGFLAVVLIAFLIWAIPAVLVIAWNWVVPDLFSGAVAQGLIPETITWVQGFKLGYLVAAMSGWLIFLNRS